MVVSKSLTCSNECELNNKSTEPLNCDLSFNVSQRSFITVFTPLGSILITSSFIAQKGYEPPPGPAPKFKTSHL